MVVCSSLVEPATFSTCRAVALPASRDREGLGVPRQVVPNRSLDGGPPSRMSGCPLTKVKRSHAGLAVERPLTAAAVVQPVAGEWPGSVWKRPTDFGGRLCSGCCQSSPASVLTLTGTWQSCAAHPDPARTQLGRTVCPQAERLANSAKTIQVYPEKFRQFGFLSTSRFKRRYSPPSTHCSR